MVNENIEFIRGQIALAAQRAGRHVSEIQLIAVSKTYPPEAVREAMDSGQFLFGESRVQEARAKIPMISGRAHWHFIGHLQRNKIRQALPLFELFHGIDTLENARDMERIADEEGFHPRILLEVNVAGESSKFGFSPDRLRKQMEELLGFGRLQIEGLMTMAPLAPDPENSRRYFAQLRELRNSLQEEFRVPLPQLSMGMSGDYLVGVEEGATMVRIGTAIFGARRKPEPRSGIAEQEAAD